jgi:DNA-binding phage protein
MTNKITKEEVGTVEELTADANILDKTLRNFVLVVKREMQNQEVSASAIARKVGIHPAGMFRILSGRLNITIDTMTKILDAIGIEIQYVRSE